MEFSSRDLADIQRVAGLLNLTVDELLQQSRARAQEHNVTPLASPLQTSSTQPIFVGDGIPDNHNQAFLDLDSDFLSLDHPQSNSSGNDFAHPGPHHQETEVILLNPQVPWYDCDAALWTQHNSFSGLPDAFLDGEAAFPEPNEERYSMTTSALDMGRSSINEHAGQDENREAPKDDALSDWMILSPFGSSDSQLTLSSSGTPTDKRFHSIAPRFSKSPSAASSSRVKKKRSRYEGAKRADTHLTRQLHACVRCRMQRNRCIPDPSNPRGPCLTCQRKTARMSRLQCLRYMVTDSTLFRTGLDYMAFYRAHPMIGPHYGDFHLERQWTNVPSKFLCLGQIGSMHLQVEIKQFVPPTDPADIDLKGRPMYAVPWAIADPDAVVAAITEYIERGIVRYMTAYLDDTDPLVWNIFQAAYRASVFPVPNDMLRKTLRLWVACRFIESKWRCWAESGWADSEIRAANPQDPFYKDLDSLPPYIDYQLASIIIHRILTPLRRDVLRDLQATLNIHNPKDWFVTFLTCFILLQNYEMQMLFQRQFAERRKAPVQYLDMPLVRATNSGAKTILAHFHYCYKGQRLFTQDFDWTSPRVRRMAKLDAEQMEFMGQCRDVVVKRAPKFQAINRSDAYYEKWWYTSQLFDTDWTPRDTLEHAPPADTVVMANVV